MQQRFRTLLPRLPSSPGFRRLWLAASVSEFGDWSARLALAALIFERTGDPAWVGIVALVFIAPRFGLGQILTGWSERLPRRRLLVVGDSARAAVFLVLGLFDLAPVPVLALVFVAATIDPIFEANAAAATFDTLSDDERDDGVRFRQVTVLLSQVAGVGAAGVVLRWLAPQTVLLANAVSFALSALIIAGAVIVRTEEIEATAREALRAAARAIAASAHIRAALFTTTITIFAAVAAEAQVVVFAEGRPSWVLPAASAVVPLAAAVGAGMAPTRGDTRTVLHKTLATTTTCVLVGGVALELDRSWAIVVVFAAAGLIFQTAAVGQVIAVRHLPAEGRASILTLLQTVVLFGSAAGATASGFAMNALGNARGIQVCFAVALLAWLVPLPEGETNPSVDEIAVASG